MKKRILLLATVLMFASTGIGFATPINSLGGGDGSEQNLQQILNDLTTPDNALVAVGPVNDALVYDQYWKISGGGGGSVATMVIEIAGLAGVNSFGIYNPLDNSKRAEIFAGADGAADSKTIRVGVGGVVSIDGIDTSLVLSSNLFGFYLYNGTDYFYSDTALNGDSFDHFVAFQGINGVDIQLPGSGFPGPWSDKEYILAWEDTIRGGDWDYNDMVIGIESVQPVPEPATMLMLGAGLLGLAAYGRKRLV